MIEVELFLLVDSNGDRVCGLTADAAREMYESDIGNLNECEGFRLVKLLVKVPLPEVVALTGTAPAQGAATLSIA